MDYPCGKFDDCGFSRFVFLCGQTNAQTHVDERFTPATVVGVSK